MFPDNKRKVYKHSVQSQIDQCMVWLLDKQKRSYSIWISIHCYLPKKHFLIEFLFLRTKRLLLSLFVRVLMASLISMAHRVLFVPLMSEISLQSIARNHANQMAIDLDRNLQNRRVHSRTKSAEISGRHARMVRRSLRFDASPQRSQGLKHRDYQQYSIPR